MRAFLSHSSMDKPLVGQVADHLKRARVWLDKSHIETAADIREALKNGLETSDVFVLFASKRALQSEWVKWEVSFAERQLLAGRMPRICAFLIEDGLLPGDLPTIFHNVQIRRESSPRIIAQEIIRVIQECESSNRQALFVGRGDEISECARRMNGVGGQTPPSTILLFGLEGIGRRSVLAQFARNNLGLPSRIDVSVALGDGLPETALSIESAIGVPATEAQLGARYKSLQQMMEVELLANVAELVRAATEKGALLTLVDQGGLIDEEGVLRDWVPTLATRIAESGSGQLAVVSRRRPTAELNEGVLDIPYIRIPQLSADDTASLLAALLRNRQVRYSGSELKELAAHVSGYPPAAYYAAEIAKQDGLAMLLADTSALGRVTETRFLRVLEHDHRLDKTRQELMRLLANYSPLPLRVLVDYLGLEPESCHRSMRYLLDIGIVYPVGSYYKLADPVVRAVSRLYGVFNVKHGTVAELLADHLSDMDQDDPARLPIIRMYFRAVQLSGGKANRKSRLQFSSDQIAVAMELYHSQDYERAVKVAEDTLDQNPQLVDVRDYLIRSLIQLERYDDAESQIETLTKHGRARDAAFLAGFLSRRRGMHFQAIQHYERALSLGRRGVSVHRELAQCYFEEADLQKAEAHIAKASEIDPDNSYVVDLKCQIATRIGNQTEAFAALTVLEYIDRKEYFLHRKSVVLFTFGDVAGALDAAEQAHEMSSRPRFQILAQLVKMLIVSGDYETARMRLEDLDAKFKGRRRDIRVGLRCKLLAAQGNFEDAMTVWGQLEQRSSKIHKILKLQILQGKVGSDQATDGERLEAERLEQELGYAGPDWSWLDELS